MQEVGNDIAKRARLGEWCENIEEDTEVVLLGQCVCGCFGGRHACKGCAGSKQGGFAHQQGGQQISAGV